MVFIGALSYKGAFSYFSTFHSGIDYLLNLIISRFAIPIMSFLNSIEYMTTSTTSSIDAIKGVFGVSLYRLECLLGGCGEKNFTTLAGLNFKNIFLEAYLLPNSGATPGIFASLVYFFPFGFILLVPCFYALRLICGGSKPSFVHAFVILYCFSTFFKSPTDLLIFPSDGLLAFIIVLLMRALLMQRNTT